MLHRWSVVCGCFSLLITVSLGYWVRDDVECVHNKLHISFAAVVTGLNENTAASVAFIDEFQAKRRLGTPEMSENTVGLSSAPSSSHRVINLQTKALI